LRNVADYEFTENGFVRKNQLVLNEACEKRVRRLEMGDPDAGVNEYFHRDFVRGREDLRDGGGWVPKRLAWFRLMRSNGDPLRVQVAIEELRELILSSL